MNIRDRPSHDSSPILSRSPSHPISQFHMWKKIKETGTGTNRVFEIEYYPVQGLIPLSYFIIKRKELENETKKKNLPNP